MRKSRTLETGRDRKALARDAGLGRISVVSVLAGSLSASGAFAALLAAFGLVALAVNGGHDFSGLTGAQFKDGTAVVVAGAVFLAFVFGGYTAGRMSRRSGAAHGAVAGTVGVVLGAVAVVLVRSGGGAVALARVAVHLNAPSTWHDWRSVGVASTLVSVAAMVLGGLIGGAAGERWHAKLLARAADSGYGPEAERLAEARRQAVEAEAAHVAAQERVARATAAGAPAGTVPTPVGTPVASGSSFRHRQPVVASAPDHETVPGAGAEAATGAKAARETEVRADADGRHGRGARGGPKPRRHLLHR